VPTTIAPEHTPAPAAGVSLVTRPPAWLTTLSLLAVATVAIPLPPLCLTRAEADIVVAATVQAVGAVLG